MPLDAPLTNADMNHTQKNSNPKSVFHYWMKKDAQRSKTYRAERSMYFNNRSANVLETRAQAVALIMNIEDALEIYSPNYFTPDVLVTHKLRIGLADYAPDAGIRLSPEFHEWTVIHEWAHHATAMLTGEAHAPHGRDFRRFCYLAALETYGRSSDEVGMLREGYKRERLSFL